MLIQNSEEQIADHLHWHTGRIRFLITQTALMPV